MRTTLTQGKTVSEVAREILSAAVSERPLGARIGRLRGQLEPASRQRRFPAPPASQAQLAALKVWLLDTGPLVAYLDAADKDHSRVAAALDVFTGNWSRRLP